MRLLEGHVRQICTYRTIMSLCDKTRASVYYLVDSFLVPSIVGLIELIGLHPFCCVIANVHDFAHSCSFSYCHRRYFGVAVPKPLVCKSLNVVESRFQCELFGEIVIILKMIAPPYLCLLESNHNMAIKQIFKVVKAAVWKFNWPHDLIADTEQPRRQIIVGYFIDVFGSNWHASCWRLGSATSS